MLQRTCDDIKIVPNPPQREQKWRGPTKNLPRDQNRSTERRPTKGHIHNCWTRKLRSEESANQSRMLGGYPILENLRAIVNSRRRPDSQWWFHIWLFWRKGPNATICRPPHHLQWKKADQDNLGPLPCGRC